jgi:quinol monooxygenase YgiN
MTSHLPQHHRGAFPVEGEACRIVELRRYALRPGARETLIALFDREFVESQEELGMHLLGQFRDLDNPDSFVWLRGFSDMQTRKRALENFYGGPVWKANAAAANATMIDVGNVLLLRPLSGLVLETGGRPPPGSTSSPPSLFVVTIYPLAEPAADDFPEFFARELQPALREFGISVLATYATEHSRNTYPALPVREDENVFVWLTIFVDEADHARHQAQLEQSSVWRDWISLELVQRLDGPEEVLRLRPTARSLLHG